MQHRFLASLQRRGSGRRRRRRARAAAWAWRRERHVLRQRVPLLLPQDVAPPPPPAGPPAAGGGRGGGVSVVTIRALLARHGLLRGNLVFVESSSRFVCAPVAPGRRRPCPFVPDGHRSNRGTVVLRAVGGGAPPVATYYCYSGRCRGRSLALGAAK